MYSKLSQDTGPDRKLLKKINELRIRVENAQAKLMNILSGDEANGWDVAHRAIVKIQYLVTDKKKLTKKDFEYMNKVHKELKEAGE